MRASESAASLLEIDPRLGSVLGPLQAAALGHRPVARVVTIAAGPWAPPTRAALGRATIALVVLDGLLLGDTQARVLAGPLDRVEPWDAAVRWTACTRVRAAVIGEPFVRAVGPWPAVVARLLARPARPFPRRVSSGPPEERLLTLLWHLAARWGHRELGAIAMPLALDAGVLGRLTALADAEVTSALAALRRRSAAVRRDAGGWLLPGADGAAPAGASSARRDALRARAAEQLAVARAAQADCNALCRDVAVELRRVSRLPGARPV